MSPFTERKAGYQTQFLELTLSRMSRLLGIQSQRKHVVLIFRNADEYWRYVSFFSGSSGGSVGMCVRNSLVHLVSYDKDVNMLQATLAHELVHDLLTELELPLWLEEGLCQTFATSGLEGIAKGAGGLRQHAVAHGLGDFWNGRGFAAEEERQKFCYSLAEILARLLLDEKSFRPFLESARREDCGQEACRQIFGRSLGQFVGTFLGPGDWEPAISRVHELWGLLHESRWERAIEVAESQTDPVMRLGKAIALSETPRWREGLRILVELPPEVKSVEVWIREFWLQLYTEEPECAQSLDQLERLGHPTESLRGAWMYATGRYGEALKCADWAGWAEWKLGTRPSVTRRDLVSLLLQVEFCLEDREWERAWTLLQDCLHCTSEDITTWQLLGKLAEARGSEKEALQAYSRCVEVFDLQGRAWKPERERVEFARQRLLSLGATRPNGEIGFGS
ncbi:MAG: hypothetical protein J0I12_26705 [Candidatus Eremiobacteraeota bacterium]|nr:hypothetical protein [Candidatus Eremiobacteraeota bacterium]